MFAVGQPAVTELYQVFLKFGWVEEEGAGMKIVDQRRSYGTLTEGIGRTCIHDVRNDPVLHVSLREP